MSITPFIFMVRGGYYFCHSDFIPAIEITFQQCHFIVSETHRRGTIAPQLTQDDRTRRTFFCSSAAFVDWLEEFI